MSRESRAFLIGAAIGFIVAFGVAWIIVAAHQNWSFDELNRSLREVCGR